MTEEICVVSHVRSDQDRVLSDENFIDLSNKDRDRHIYRIISLSRMFKMFSSSANVFVKPNKWEDPFENFILRSRIRFPSGEIYSHGNRDGIYGQCWTLQSASDAMWRIYSPKGDAVRIRTTPRRLARSIIQSPVVRPHTVRVGKVSYLSQAALTRFARGAFKTSEDSYTAMGRTLLVKRLAFKHEREVRALIFATAGDEAKGASDLLKCQVDPHALIDQVMLDPRYSAENAESVRKQILRQTNFRGEILKSLLYAPPPRFVLDFAIPKPKRPPRLDIPPGWVQMVPVRKRSKRGSRGYEPSVRPSKAPFRDL